MIPKINQRVADWAQEEFDFLNSPYAVPLSEFVVEDIKRISERKVIYSVDEWKEKAEPASTVVEAPVYAGIWLVGTPEVFCQSCF